jgi:hypothetical protein
MAKNRDDRYRSTEEMLEDLKAVRAGGSPTHATRAVSLEALKELEEKGKTVDLTPTVASPWTRPLVVILTIATVVSVLVNFVLFVLLSNHK